MPLVFPNKNLLPARQKPPTLVALKDRLLQPSYGWPRRRAGGAAGPNFFEVLTSLGLTSNLRLCLDAGALASYETGQKWLDLAGGGYDFFRGADGSVATDDPTLVGTPGAVDGVTAFEFDGGDRLVYEAANETWMNSFHKDLGKGTLLMWYRPAVATIHSIGGTITSSGAAIGIAADIGATSGTKCEFQVADGASELYVISDAITISLDTWHLFATSFDEGVGTGFFFLDGNYVQVAAANTFTCTYPSPTASDATTTFELASEGNGTVLFSNGSRLATVAIYDAALTKTNLDDIWTNTRTRFGV